VPIQWTKSLRAKLLPYPGDDWTTESDLRKAAKAIEKIAGAVPEHPTLEAEVQRGLTARLDHRYNEAGNHPRDTLGRELVDLWCARRGVEFATEVLIAIARTRPANAQTREDKPYKLRRDGQPWGRLREHLLGGSSEQLEAARALAERARGEPAGELRPALAYAFCDADWVAEDLEAALKAGYGQLALLSCLSAEPAAATLRKMIGGVRFQLIEEAVPHIPNVMSRLGEAGSSLIVGIAELAWDKSSRKPWLELVGCYDTEEARAFVAKHAPKAK
jgi:hypothetical protein